MQYYIDNRCALLKSYRLFLIGYSSWECGSVGIHAISHLDIDLPRLLHASENKYELMKPIILGRSTYKLLVLHEGNRRTYLSFKKSMYHTLQHSCSKRSHQGCYT